MSDNALGPLAGLVGTWEGDKGDDIAPDADPKQTVNNKYREQMVFEETGQVNNHGQTLFGLRYRTTAWRIGEDNAFHEELGYWLWDAKNQQVMRCFMVPRGVTIIAGGKAEADAQSLTMSAEVGSETYGICSNKFLNEEFKTTRYDLKFSYNEDGTITYEETTFLKIKGQDKEFVHTDKNTLKKV